jgi:hypothetical protein
MPGGGGAPPLVHPIPIIAHAAPGDGQHGLCPMPQEGRSALIPADRCNTHFFFKNKILCK